jgi:hypothetical protein
MKYNAKHAFNVSQPAWNGRYRKLYGPKNEGFTFEADNLEHAQQVLKDKYNLNPFYVLINPVS